MTVTLRGARRIAVGPAAPAGVGRLNRRARMTAVRRWVQASIGVSICALLAGCASTSVTLTPPNPLPVCDRSAAALVLWAPQWRPDQKDVVQREEAATAGLERFLATPDCFARSELRRVADLAPATIRAQSANTLGQFTRVVAIGVRELGPIVKLLSSAALVEGGTEVVLQVTDYSAAGAVPAREFTVHWKNGGPGVVKGVASLPDDLQAALRAGLQAGAGARP